MIRTPNAAPIINYGTYAHLCQELDNEFSPTYSEEAAHEKLKNLRQKDKPIDEHNIEFKNLVAQANLATEPKSVIALYQESLKLALLMQVLQKETPCYKH